MELCKNFISGYALLDAFLLTYDRMRRYQGAWHLEKKLLFPASVLLESENEKELREELSQHKDITGYRTSVVKLNPEDETFLRFLCGKTRHIGMSKGVICNGVTQVKEGPLKGMETKICKIDRHKRLARLQLPKGQNLRYIPAGLEIVEKSI